MNFELHSDGKFRLMTSEGLFTADSAKHSIKEVNKAYESGGFTEMLFTTKDGDKVFCIANSAEKVGKDYDEGVVTTVAPAQERKVLKITLDYKKV
jgi:hypothetical protein